MSEITWTENYGFYRANIGTISMVVHYGTMKREDPSGYYVEVAGSKVTRKLKSPVKTLKEGQEAAIRLATKLATETLNELQPASDLADEVARLRGELEAVKKAVAPLIAVAQETRNERYSVYETLSVTVLYGWLAALEDAIK